MCPSTRWSWLYRLRDFFFCQDKNEEQPTTPKRDYTEEALSFLRWGMVIAALSIIAFALRTVQAISQQSILASLGSLCIGLAIAGAAAFVGGAVGFLFGIPRSTRLGPMVAGINEQEPGASREAGVSYGGRLSSYGTNTNIEEISDWLTKILVGVSLVQLGQIRANLAALNRFLAQGFTPAGQAKVFTFGLASYCATLGFFYGYLWTRLNLKRALDNAELIDLKSEVQNLGKQIELDQKAAAVVNRQLNLSPDSLPIPQDELNRALSKASDDQRQDLFNRAWRQRWTNRTDAGGLQAAPQDDDQRKEQARQRGNVVSATIPVFRALIFCDKENKNHHNYGQLAYALKDMAFQLKDTNPQASTQQFQAAVTELSRAIQIRDAQKEQGFRLYEANRAHIRILLDQNFIANQPSSPEQQQLIRADLDQVASDVNGPDSAQTMVNAVREIQEWKILNPA